MCDYPINIKNPNYGKYYDEFKRILVPCGKCVSCTKKRANQWMLRIMHEMKYATSAHFVTLTYANAPRTNNGLLTVDKKHIQDFLKRLRKREKSNKNIKYYLTSEYGGKTHRPHYHMIIMNVGNENNILRAWSINNLPIGNVHILPVEQACISYVTGYIGKKIGIPWTDYDDRVPEFSLMSKKIGISYITNTYKYHKELQIGYTTLHGVKYNLPRYYKDKIYTKNEKRKIGKANYAHFLENEAKNVKNFNSILDFEKNKREIAERNNRSPRTINIGHI